MVVMSLAEELPGESTSVVEAAMLLSAVITVGSLVPVIVTSICLVMRPPFWSSSVMVKLSTLVWSLARYSTAEEETAYDQETHPDVPLHLVSHLFTPQSQSMVLPEEGPVAHSGCRTVKC